MKDLSVILLIIQLLCVIGFFAFLSYACGYIVKWIKSIPELKDSKLLNPLEYFPHEAVLNLKQVFYLVMILVFIVLALYSIFKWNDGSYYICILDIIVSIYLVRSINRTSVKDNIILFLLIPISSLTYLLFGYHAFVLFEYLHALGYLYFIEVYYRKFVKYTENNNLGITIMLLFSIILISFLFTMIVEEVSPLDSIVMVSNAFTSNSFDAAGNTVVGKLDSLLLAWGGYILSGVGTATLAVSMIRRHVDRQFDDMEEMIKNKAL